MELKRIVQRRRRELEFHALGVPVEVDDLLNVLVLEGCRKTKILSAGRHQASHSVHLAFVAVSLATDAVVCGLEALNADTDLDVRELAHDWLQNVPMQAIGAY